MHFPILFPPALITSGSPLHLSADPMQSRLLKQSRLNPNPLQETTTQTIVETRLTPTPAKTLPKPNQGRRTRRTFTGRTVLNEGTDRAEAETGRGRGTPLPRDSPAEHPGNPLYPPRPRTFASERKDRTGPPRPPTCRSSPPDPAVSCSPSRSPVSSPQPSKPVATHPTGIVPGARARARAKERGVEVGQDRTAPSLLDGVDVSSSFGRRTCREHAEGSSAKGV